MLPVCETGEYEVLDVGLDGGPWLWFLGGFVWEERSEIAGGDGGDDSARGEVLVVGYYCTDC